MVPFVVWRTPTLRGCMCIASRIFPSCWESPAGRWTVRWTRWPARVFWSVWRRIGAGTLDAITRCLRPGRITWESCESALSQWGVISQIPVGRTTYMTTGREGEFHTRFGVIDLTHSKLPPSRIIGNLAYRDDGRLPIATKRFAYDNLRSTGRNLGLVDMDELEDDDEW